MFDTVITKCVQPKSVNWITPERLELDIGEEQLTNSELLKGAINYLYSKIDLKFNTSKEVFKKSQGIWTQLKNLQVDKAKDVPGSEFYLTKDTVVYLLNDINSVVDMEDLNTEENVEQFKDLHKKFTLELTTTNKTKKFFTDGKGGLIKFVCYNKNYDVTQQKYTPVVLLELNTTKSTYMVYNGILIYDTFTFIPNSLALINNNSLINFIQNFNMDKYLEYADEDAERLYDMYNSFVPVEISARELTSLVKKAGYKLEIDPLSGSLLPINNINDEANGEKVASFYNTFRQESALDILSLNEFKKTFKYNKLTLEDLLQIFSKEYLQYDGSKITAELLGDLVFRLIHLSNTDKKQTDTIIDEVK